MRFSELEFHRVGVWRDLAPLCPGPRLTVVLGDNEAGKSTSMRAIEALLFEPTRELVAPLTSVTDFNASARVRLMDGSELGWRRQGRKVEPAEAAEKLESLAPPEQRSTFRDLFRLGHDQVRADASFLSDEGALGRVLFAAESGASAARLNETDKALRDAEKAAESGSRAGSGLKKLANEFKALREKQEKRAGFGDYDRTDAEIEEVDAGIKALRDELTLTREEQKKLDAWKTGLSHARTRQDAIDQLALLADAGHLASSEQAQAIREAVTRLDEAIAEHRQRAQKLEEAQSAVKVLPPVPPVAAFAAEVDDLDRKVGSIEKDQKILEEARASLSETKRNLRELLVSAFDLRGDDDSVLRQARELLVSQATRRKFKELLEDGDQAQGALESARRAMDDAVRKSRQAREAAEASTELPTTALTQALELVQKLSALDERLEALEKQQHDAADKARAARRTLGLGAFDEAAIANLALPSRDRLDEGFRKLEKARQTVDAAIEKLDAARAKEQEAREAEQSLRHELQDAVTDAAFEAARRARDEAWQQVKATWTPAWKSSAPLELPVLGASFEGRLIEVDLLADRRFQNASQLGKLAKATEHHEAAKREVRRCEEALSLSESEAATASATWQALWSFLEAAPDRHIDWLNGFKQLIDHLDVAERASTEHAQHRAKRETLRADVGRLLSQDLTTSASLDTAAALQNAIQDELKRRKAHNDEATRRRNERETQEKNARDAAHHHEEKQGEAERWTERWSREVAELPTNVLPQIAAVRLWLSQQDALSQLCRDLEKYDEVITKKTTEIEAFEARVRALLDRVRAEDPGLPVPASLAPLAALSELSRLAKDARLAQSQLGEKEKDLRYASAEAANAQEAVDNRRNELTTRWLESGFQGEWTRERIEIETTRADDAQALRDRILQCESVLRPLWKERELDAVLAAIAGRNEDDLASDARRETERSEALETQREALTERKLALEQAKKSLESDQSVEADQNLALASDRLLDKANELATLKAALWLLNKAREKAAAGATPLVELASQNFAQLTGGEYLRLEIDRDGASPTLRAIPAHGDSRKAEELSDGTLDQLWLALRLAVVQQAAKNTPWPLVLDDVFVHFDDQRTTHALKLLARLSEQVQVIVFTHHDHVVDLARAAVPEVLEVVTLARAEHRERLLPEGRERHERPEAPAAVLSDAKTGAAGSSDAYSHILSVLENASAPMGKADVLAAVEEAFGVSVERDWNKTIGQLLLDGRVAKEGEKRGVKYSVAQAGEATASG